jgi:hypothetical protein
MVYKIRMTKIFSPAVPNPFFALIIYIRVIDGELSAV